MSLNTDCPDLIPFVISNCLVCVCSLSETRNTNRQTKRRRICFYSVMATLCFSCLVWTHTWSLFQTTTHGLAAEKTEKEQKCLAKHQTKTWTWRTNRVQSYPVTHKIKCDTFTQNGTKIGVLPWRWRQKTKVQQTVLERYMAQRMASVL
jgi:hypothetical protein